MKYFKWVMLSLIISIVTITYGQSLRTIDTDIIAPNATGSTTIDIAADVTINSSAVAADDILDEDDLLSDSATALASQQSIKAYVDNAVTTIGGLGDVVITNPQTNEVLTWNGSEWVNLGSALLTTLGVGGTLGVSTVFDVTSTTLGSRPCPSMTEVQRDAIVTPATGLCVFNTDTSLLNTYNGVSWDVMSTVADLTSLSDVTLTGPALNEVLQYNGAGQWVNVPNAGGIGQWVTAKAYLIDDIVNEGTLIYRALTNHTSGVFATDLANNEWIQLNDYSDSVDVFYKTDFSVEAVFENEINKGINSDIVVSDDGGLNFSWTAGAVYESVAKDGIAISSGSGACVNNTITYLYWNTGTALTVSTTPSSGTDVKVADIGCQDGDIVSLHTEDANSSRTVNLSIGAKTLLPLVNLVGNEITEDTDVTNVWDVSASGGYTIIGVHDIDLLPPIDSRTTPMLRQFKTAGAWDSDSNIEIDPTQYNDGTDLVAVNPLLYYKSCFFISATAIYWIYPEVGTSLSGATQASCPTIPPGIKNILQTRALVLLGAATAFPLSTSSFWIDIRPQVDVSTGEGLPGDYNYNFAYETYATDAGFEEIHASATAQYNSFGTMPNTVPPLAPDYPDGDDLYAGDTNIGDDWQISLQVQFQDLTDTQQRNILGVAGINRGLVLGVIASSNAFYVSAPGGAASYECIFSASGELLADAFNEIVLNRAGLVYELTVNGNPHSCTNLVNDPSNTDLRSIGKLVVTAQAFNGYVRSYSINSIDNPAANLSGGYTVQAVLEEGSIYYNTTDKLLRDYRQGTWRNKESVNEWQKATLYVPDMITWQGAALYLCKTEHTSGSTTIQDDLINWVPLSGDTFDTIRYNQGIIPSSEPEGLTWWNDSDKTINISTGEGPVLQVGQEMYVRVHNATGSTIPSGAAVYPIGAVGTFPSVALANADVHTSFAGTVLVATANIADGTEGFGATQGKVREVDTSAWGLGDTLWLSATTDGGLTNVKPAFPNYAIQIGGVAVVDAADGIIQLSIKGDEHSTLQSAWNGTIRESFDFRVTSNGTVITGALSPSNGHPDLTLLFSDGFSTFTATPDATIALTAGTDTNPQTNYIYILESSKALTVSTSDWPTVEHSKVAQVTLKSAANTQLDGALSNQNWNDHVADTTNFMGHLLHISEAIRTKLPATWASGTAGSVTVDTGPAPDAVYAAVTGGFVRQMHKQAYPAQDMTQYTIDAVNTGTSQFTISDDGDLTSTFFIGKEMKVHDSTGNDGFYTINTILWSSPDFIITVDETIGDATVDGTIGDDAIVINDFTTAYNTILSLSEITLDSDGAALANSSASFVLWGIANKTGEVSQMMINVPSGTYGRLSPDNAVNDADGYSNYSIPSTYNGTGFLIARFTFQITAGGDWSLYDTEDLRGKVPNTTAGGGTGGGGATDFLALLDTPSTYTSQALNIPRVNAGETALEFLDITLDWLTQYGLLLGRSGGQTLIGGIDTSDDLTLTSTSNATKGDIIATDPLVAQSRVEVAEALYAKNGVFSYVANSGAEVGNTGWATYNDGAVAKPVDGTGGTATTTWVRNTTTPLFGAGDFLLTKGSVIELGEGISYDFTIENADQAQPLQINFRATTSANYADGDIGVYLYDVTNAKIIEPTPIDLQAGTYGKFTSSFQTSVDSTSYRLIFHVQTTNVTAYTVNIDNVEVNTEPVVYGAPITNEEDLNITLTAFGNATVTEAKYSRIGEVMHARMRITIGSTLPTGAMVVNLTDHTMKSVTAAMSIGYVNGIDASGSQTYIAGLFYNSSTSFYFQGGSGQAFWSATVPFTWAAGDIIDVTFDAPIAGWDSQVQMSETTMNRLIAAQMGLNTGSHTTSASWQLIPFNLANNDTVAGFNLGTNSYTIPETGRYTINVAAKFTATTGGSIGMRIRVNGTADERDEKDDTPAGFFATAQMSLTKEYTKDDVIDFQAIQSSGASRTYDTVNTYFHIAKVSTGSQTIAASATTTARYRSVTAQSIPNNTWTIIDFDTVSYDTTNRVTIGASWKFTADKHGYYNVKSKGSLVSTSFTAGERTALAIYKNGAIYSRIELNTIDAALTKTSEISGSDTVEMVKGDYIDIRVFQDSGAAITLDNTTLYTQSYVAIERVK